MKSLRGKIVERFILDMKEMRELVARLGKLAESKGWEILEPVSGARTIDGNEIADWMIVATREDGSIWIMALIESKSISNTRDLASHKGRGVGQHLWDWLRLRTEGLVLTKEDGSVVKYLPKQIKGDPVPPGAPPPSHGLTTELIAVTPRDFSKGQLRNISAQGADIKRWPWPVDETNSQECSATCGKRSNCRQRIKNGATRSMNGHYSSVSSMMSEPTQPPKL